MRLLLLVLAAATVQVESYHATTRQGKLNGTIEYTFEGDQVLTFKGIPFGKAPVGERRFKHSEAYGSWQGTLNATSFSPACMQNKGWSYGSLAKEVESEDCLFLNIYVPGNNIDNVTPKAVMVWIHGGGLIEGAAQLYGSQDLAYEGDVIVVTFNYRLGMYGFMTTGDDVIPGNMGIGDQILALQWIKDNIADYGGDTGRITIFGESAGGWAVSVLTASPSAEGLFHRAIGQSGTIMYAEHRSSKMDEAYRLTERVGCASVWSSSDILTCMRNASSDHINSLVGEFMPAIYTDDYILPMEPVDIWEQGKQNDVDYMIGVTSADGSASLEFMDPSMEFYQTGLDESTVKMMIEEVLEKQTYDDNCPDAHKIITEHYFQGQFRDNYKNLEGVIDMSTDHLFVAPAVQLSHFAMKNSQDVYWYYFTQPPKPGTPAGDAKIEMGAAHASELNYVFGWYLGWGSESDVKLTRSMIRAWTSFAKTGDPMWIDNYGYEHIWPKYTLEEAKYLEFRDNLDPEKNVQDWMMDARAKFWLETLQECEIITTSGSQKLGVYHVMILPIFAMLYMLWV